MPDETGLLANSVGELSVNAEGELLIGAAGAPCCCDEGGTSGQCCTHWIIGRGCTAVIPDDPPANQCCNWGSDWTLTRTIVATQRETSDIDNACTGLETWREHFSFRHKACNDDGTPNPNPVTECAYNYEHHQSWSPSCQALPLHVSVNTTNCLDINGALITDSVHFTNVPTNFGSGFDGTWTPLWVTFPEQTGECSRHIHTDVPTNNRGDRSIYDEVTNLNPQSCTGGSVSRRLEQTYTYGQRGTYRTTKFEYDSTWTLTRHSLRGCDPDQFCLDYNAGGGILPLGLPGLAPGHLPGCTNCGQDGGLPILPLG